MTKKMFVRLLALAVLAWCYELRRSSPVSWAIGSSTVGLACCHSFRMVLLCSIPHPLALFDRTVVKLPTAKLESDL